MVIGELACGHLRDRNGLLAELKSLPEITVLENDEVLQFIETNGLMGLGIGYIDFHLLAAVVNEEYAQLWTFDGKLQNAAASKMVAYCAEAVTSTD